MNVPMFSNSYFSHRVPTQTLVDVQLASPVAVEDDFEGARMTIEEKLVFRHVKTLVCCVQVRQ